jgi:hypothetical protein
MEKSDRNDVDWRVLCELASKEHDPEKLMEIVQRLNEALEERLRGQGQHHFRADPRIVPGAWATMTQ